MHLPFITRTYRAWAPDVSSEDVDLIVMAAVDRAREKHADFDRFLPGVEFLSTVVFCDHKLIPLDDYLETLYCAVKHGDFTKSWRQQLKPRSDSNAPTTTS